MPGPLGRPTDRGSPEVSECSRIPVSRRPVSTAVTACPPSCTIVTRFRAQRQNPSTTTTTSAASPVPATSQLSGSYCRTQSRLLTPAPRTDRQAQAPNGRPLSLPAHAARPRACSGRDLVQVRDHLADQVAQLAGQGAAGAGEDDRHAVLRGGAVHGLGVAD